MCGVRKVSVETPYSYKRYQLESPEDIAVVLLLVHPLNMLLLQTCWNACGEQDNHGTLCTMPTESMKPP